MFARISGLRHKIPGLGVCLAVILVGGLIAVLATSPPVGAAGGESDGSPTIAVVNLSGVFRATEQWKDYQAKHQESLEEMQRSLSKLEKNARILRSEYENLAPGTDARKSKRDELEKALQEFQTKKNSFQQDISKKYNEFLYKMFRNVTTTVEEYADQNNIDIVLKKTNLQQSPTAPSQTDLMIATTNVLYAGEKVDITDQVTKKLNSEYPGQIEVK